MIFVFFFGGGGALKAVIWFEESALVQWFIISGGSSSPLHSTIFFNIIISIVITLKSRVTEYAIKQLSTSESICQWQMTIRRNFLFLVIVIITIHFPDEFVRKGPVIVLLNFCVKLLHPTYFEEEFREVFIHFVPNFLLYAVPEFLVAVFSPEFVYGF